MNYRFLTVIFVCFANSFTTLFAQPFSGENLSRALVAIPTDSTFYLSWRFLLSDNETAEFDIFRSTNGAKAKKLNKKPITKTTDFVDTTAIASVDNEWVLKCNGKIVDRYERKASTSMLPYLSIPINQPEEGEVAGQKFGYTANDCSIGDLDGDGEFEIVLKWYPTNSKRPPEKGFSGPSMLDAYKLDGTQLWRINLGNNIRSGACTTNFLVFDFDGDGRSEIVCKTGDGTIDGQNKVIGDSKADHRTWEDGDMYGKVVDGIEYLTIFDGATGRALDTQEYIPTRYPIDGWGGIGGNAGNDKVGSRSDRFTACVALLDGKTPSAIMIRGWYGRTVLAAWKFENSKLLHQWTFDSSEPGNEGYSGMANHSVTVADFDGDGFDEICVGAMTVDHDGKGLYTTRLRHGDALHAGRFIPKKKGLQVFGIHENEGRNPIRLTTPAVALFDGATGEILWQDGLNEDAGRGVAADIDPRYEGAECWCNVGGLRRCDNGIEICQKKPSSCNFIIYWDADSLVELLDHTSISKWNWETEDVDVLLEAKGCVSNNGTKGNPCLTADIFGDWREEAIWANEEQTELRIYSTTIPAIDRRVTMLADRQYRLSIVWQNVAYNQPPHPSY